jgi:hypothetical protein
MSTRPIFGKLGQAVPEVDPSDLKAAFHAAINAGTKTVGIGAFVPVCKPGADLEAVSYRTMLLGGFIHMVQMRLAPPWIKEGQPDDVVFKEAAQIPMTFVVGGSSPQGQRPVDFDDLLRRISAAGA